MSAPTIASCVAEVRQHIADACARSQRSVEDVQIIAVTKTRPPEDLLQLHACGLHQYAENRIAHLQEMVAHAPTPSTFHYLGRVQSRQFPDIAAHCSVLHSLAKVDHLEPLAKACRKAQRRMQIFCQINPGIDAVKAGIAPEDLPQMLEAAAQHSDCLEIIGLMTMAPDARLPAYSEDDVRACFASLRKLAQQHNLTRLSMGMSNDYVIAIEEGATDLRIGSALFPPEPSA